MSLQQRGGMGVASTQICSQIWGFAQAFILTTESWCDLHVGALEPGYYDKGVSTSDLS